MHVATNTVLFLQRTLKRIINVLCLKLRKSCPLFHLWSASATGSMLLPGACSLEGPDTEYHLSVKAEGGRDRMVSLQKDSEE